SAFGISIADEILRVAILAFGSEPEQSCSFRFILGDAVADGVELSEFILRGCEMLIGGTPIPVGSLRVISRRAVTLAVDDPQRILRFGKTLPGSKLKLQHSLVDILCHARTDQIQHAQREACTRQALIARESKPTY